MTSHNINRTSAVNTMAVPYLNKMRLVHRKSLLLSTFQDPKKICTSCWLKKSEIYASSTPMVKFCHSNTRQMSATDLLFSDCKMLHVRKITRCSQLLLPGLFRPINHHCTSLVLQSCHQSATQYRSYCDDRRTPNTPKQISLPRLMDFPQIAWPNIFKALRNWILSNFIITPYFDREFNLPDFIIGSKQAVEFVSQCLAAGDYDKLKDVVSPEALQEIKNSISRFSVQQRADLLVDKEDIYFSFPYQVGIMFNEEGKNEPQQRFVEITMCYHVLKGMKEAQSHETEKPTINIGNSAEFQDKVFILNYRFIREFTKGVTGEWIVNVVNHYRPSDYV